MEKYEIYIGLKDKDSYLEEFNMDDIAKMLVSCCSREKIAFSATQQLGGYEHNKGYTTETSVKITLIGADRCLAEKLGLKLKEIIGTDTIMITKEECECVML